MAGPRLKVLILKPSSLGDVIQALPVLRLIKLRYPESEIHWWLATELLPLLQGDPDLGAVVPFERRKWRGLTALRDQLSNIRRMRAERYDWVIDLQGLVRSGAFAWLANGSLTLGLDSSREGAHGFYDVAIRRPAGRPHAIDWYLAVLAALEVPVRWDFDWLPARRDVAAQIDAKWQAHSRRWFIINPGARWGNKRWPVEYFIALVRRLAVEYPDVHFAVLGGREDIPAGEAIAGAQSERCLNLAGQTTLTEMIEWVRLGEVMVTNDTGPMHVAAALGKPVVSLFGPTSPHFTGPYGQAGQALRVSLPCAPCLKGECANVLKPLECLRTITPEMVSREIAQRLGNPVIWKIPGAA